jgi:hypothetical protein
MDRDAQRPMPAEAADIGRFLSTDTELQVTEPG